MRESNMADPDAETGIESFGAYSLTTAEIVFAEPSKPDRAAAAVTWRDYDVTPGFPRLRAFLDRYRDDRYLSVRSVTVTEIQDAAMPACRISPSTAALH